MSTSKEYIQFVLEQLDGISAVTYKKMFGEYLVYVQERPVLLVCDNCVLVKKLPELGQLMADAPEGIPYDGAKAHYLLDIENRELVRAAIEILVQATPVPRKKHRGHYEVPPKKLRNCHLGSAGGCDAFDCLCH